MRCSSKERSGRFLDDGFALEARFGRLRFRPAGLAKIWLVASFSFFLSLNVSVQAETLEGSVLAIIDGDTVSFLTQEKEELRIRLADIDAPEIDQPWGPAAKTALAIWVEGKSGSIKVVDTDRYQRKVAYLVVEGKNINEALISEGLAWVYREYLREIELIALEREARNSGKGLWSVPDPIAPSDWRRGERSIVSVNTQKKERIGLVKKSRSGICHAPGTTYYSTTTNFQAFNTLEACLSSGGRLPKR
jgi:endonuclease YncB( thermonuclease family)